MSAEIRQRYGSTGANLYRVIVRASDGAAYNGSGFETPAAANWGTYAGTLTEQSTTQLYYGTMPSVSAGLYDVLVFLRAGGSPATTDALVGQASIDWGGAAETTVTSRLASSGYAAPLDAAGTRAAVGLASASLDTQLAAIAGYIDTEVAAIKAKTDNLPASPAATGDIPTVSQIWTTALTESYAADGAAFTAAQALYMLWSALAEFAISGTSLTCKKLDGSTSAMVFTLDDATTPTSRTRSS